MEREFNTTSPTQDITTTKTTEITNNKRTTRSKVRAAKDKETISISPKQELARSSNPGPSISHSPSKRTNRAVTSLGIVINEPPKDIKGKKRALPEPESEEDFSSHHSSPKRSRASTSTSRNYSLRPRKFITTKPLNMAKKIRRKSKASDGAGPSNQADDDVDMRSGSESDRSDHQMEQDHEVGQSSSNELPTEVAVPEASTSEVLPLPPSDQPIPASEEVAPVDAEIAPVPDAQNEDSPQTPDPPPPAETTNSGLGELGSATAALFGSDSSSIGSYMLTLSSRLKTILDNIKVEADPSTRLIALQELSELLSISTEDTLSGYFSIDSFVRELVRIMGGGSSGNTEEADSGDGEDNEEQEQDEDAALAAALAMSTGGPLPGQDSLEAQMLACRCLANLMEALPGCAHTVVYHGAVPVLCSKLVEIQYIDLAEQTLSTLEKISEEYPSAIVREGGLAALLNYLDFFNTNVQRTALQAAANCCRNASTENFTQIKEVFPKIRNVLTYSDSRLVEYACLCVIRLIESFYRSSPELLESILDRETVKAINILLLPAGGSPLVSPTTYTNFLKMLAMAAKASPQTTVALLDADIVSTIYQILTGVLPPTRDDGNEQGEAPGGQGLGGGVADMAVMQNLAHRPKELVEEALSLISELMPPLPKDGTFDHRGYTERSLAKLIKAKSKADRAAARAASSTTPSARPNIPPSTATPIPIPSPAPIMTEEPAEGQAGPSTGETQVVSDTASQEVKEKEPEKIPTREEVLREKPEIVRRFMSSTIPILVDVYAASVASQVRSRSMASLLKAISWLEAEELSSILKNVPMSSFIGSILSSNDNSSLVTCALQLVEIILNKLPQQYKRSFRREGVLHEIELRANQDLTTKSIPRPPPSPSTQSTSNSLPIIEAVAPDIAPPPLTTEPMEIPASGEGSVPIPVAESVAVEPMSGIPPDALPSSALLSVLLPPPVKRHSSSPLDPQDAVIIRCRTIRFKFLNSGSYALGDDPLENMQTLGRRLAFAQASETELRNVMTELAGLFSGDPGKGICVSSFELMKSGLVDELLEFATAEGRKVSLESRQKMLLDIFASRPSGGMEVLKSQSPLAMLVKRLQESLTRLENFEVVTVSNGEESKRGATSMLARQLRLRLVAAEGTVVPRNSTNITVSIHAIATFQALHDYLRPRIAGVAPGSSRLSGVLAAFAAAAGIPQSPVARRQASSSALSQAAIDASAMLPPPNPASSSAPELPSTSTPTPGQVGTTTSGGTERRPRRSLRLRKEAPPPVEEATTSNTGDANTADITQDTPMQTLPPQPPFGLHDDLLDDLDQDEDFLGDDFDNEVYDEAPIPANERTVSLAMAEDGQKVVAQTPDGTRVGTPAPAVAPSTPLPTKNSYASALKAKPTDWHIQFSIDDQALPLDMTVYGAVYQHIMRGESPTAMIPGLWNGVYTVKFKKVPGPVPLEGTSDYTSTERAGSPMTTSVPDDTTQAKILRLLRVLHRLNLKGAEHLDFEAAHRTLPESAFINNKLTAKLTRQLEEPMIVASSCLPDWALDLPQHYPFLFPFATRFSFLQSTSFGYARLILKWQSQQPRAQDSAARREEALNMLGRLQRQKVRISRKFLLESAVKVLELYGSASSVLEVEYFDEVGTGLGPTLEFYSLVSREFARKSLKMWHDTDASSSGSYVSSPNGLYPAPLARKEITDLTSGTGKKRTDIFRVLGQFAAKALLDSRIIDISMNKIFFKLILGEDVPHTIASLKIIDPQLAQSLSKLQPFIDAKHSIESNAKTNSSTKRAALASLAVDGVKLDDLALDFTLPGYDIELREGGRDISVEASNIEDYLREVLESLLGRGVRQQAQAFREGFSRVFPVTDLQSFTADELAMMFGNGEEDWSMETLNETIKADHGYNNDSRAIRELVDVMSTYSITERRGYLQFISGSPRLPVGGFRGLNPPLTVVKKSHEAPLRPDDYLPSVMTCVNYLKLPDYSSKEVMKSKLAIAMKEGIGSFHLS